MESENPVTQVSERKSGISPGKVVLIVLATVLVTLGGSYWFLKTYVFAREFKPVELSALWYDALCNLARRADLLEQPV